MTAVGTPPAETLPVQVVVMAKEPRPGAVKTRLCPPLSHRQAAQLATAALADTCRAVAESPVAARTVVLEGRPGDWLPAGFDVLAQRSGPFADRLAGAVHDAMARRALPVLLVGMDTPQLDAGLLGASARALLAPGVDAVLGPAYDGGFWCIGIRRAVAGLFAGVPMSTDGTGAAQWERLAALGLACGALRELRDVDDVADAVAVASQAPRSEFAAAVSAVGLRTP